MASSVDPANAHAATATLTLDDPVGAVTGIGPRQASSLGKQFAIVSIRDLVEHYPRRYSDLGDVLPITLAQVGEPVTVVGTVLAWSHRQPPRKGGGRRLRISEATVRDQGGTIFTVTFFNQDWRERRHPAGTTAAFSAKLERYRGKLRLSSPDLVPLAGPDGDLAVDDHQRLVPVYRATETVPSTRLAAWIGTALDALPGFVDPLPPAIRREHRLMDRDAAVRAIHRPADFAEAARARRRIVFDELFTLQVGLQWRRVRLEAAVAGVRNAPSPDARAAELLAVLPFELTGAQRRALTEIGDDLAADRPMHRLLQGEVGSGKTVVAAWAMLCAVDNGRQAALMVPTEVLAEQHARTLHDVLAPLGVNVLDGVRVELLTAGTGLRDRRRILGDLLSGRVDIIVGTHALLEEGVAFADLGVAVVDEQHRFGVHQRVRLKEKGAGVTGGGAERMPDVLVMTATPIPRSLALTMFGDLDVTVLDELPPARGEIITQLITPDETERRERLYEFVRQEAGAGRQTYVVCSLVAESETLQVRAAEAEFDRLRTDVFPDLRLGLVHGRMKPIDKDAVMSAFRRGEIDVLVATTVIEVGIDVSSATIMIIEDADRFGISQLHQLRGRVGRGADRSYCVLFADPATDEARARLDALVATTDGFKLAETDLELRGEGQLFGVRQSGLPDLKLARLVKDAELVAVTRAAAKELVAADRDLAAPELAPLRAEVARRYRGGLEELAALETG